MKRILTLFAAALAFVGCSHDEVVTPNIPTEKPTYYATFADAEGGSRTYLDEHLKLLWHNDDRISLFQTTYNEEYAFADPTGSNSGAFNAVESDSWVTGNQTSTTYAVYPYNAANALSNSEVLTIHFAAEQTYAEDSFGRGANTMVAATETATSKLLPFRNAGGYLMLKLYGENKTVKSIELKGNNDEVISGAATAEAKYGYLPSITMGATGGKTITLTCEEAVTLGATEEEATVFWLVVPPVTFEKGFTITVTDANGGTYTKSTSKSTTIERNTVKPMAALNPTFEGDAEDPEIPEVSIPETWKIRYTATQMVEPYDKTRFGVNYVSNEWDETTDEGVIIFDGEVTKIGDYAFRYCSMRSITIPDSVTSIGNFAFDRCRNLEAFYGKFASNDHRCLIMNDYRPILRAFAPKGVTEYTIPDGVKIIEDFSGLSNADELEILVFSDSVEEINDDLPRNLKEVVVGSNCKSIRGNFDCDYLERAIFKSATPPDSRDLFLDIGGYIAPDYLKKIHVPFNSIDLYKSDWSHLASLIEIVGTNLDTPSVMYYTTIDGNIMEVNLSQFETKIISNTYQDGRGEIRFQGYITNLGSDTFYNCENLSSVILPSSLTSIESYAFEGCSKLESVTFPEHLNYVEFLALGHCGAISHIYFKSINPPTLEHPAIFDLGLSPHIHVPYDSVNAYKNAEQWFYLSQFVEGYNFTE